MKRESTLPDAMAKRSSLAKAKMTVPHHVVYRSFPTETVVLNLQTGKYHGLNRTAGSMLDALKQAGSVREAAAAIAVEYGQPAATIERDLCDLCAALLERDLIEVDGGGSG
jgi:DNA gyrase inhibitor GyrI